MRSYINIHVAADLRGNLVAARVNIDCEGHQKCRSNHQRDRYQNSQQPHAHCENLHETRNTGYNNILCVASGRDAAKHVI